MTLDRDRSPAERSPETSSFPQGVDPRQKRPRVPGRMGNIAVVPYLLAVLLGILRETHR